MTLEVEMLHKMVMAAAMASMLGVGGAPRASGGLVDAVRSGLEPGYSQQLAMVSTGVGSFGDSIPRHDVSGGGFGDSVPRHATGFGR